VELHTCHDHFGERMFLLHMVQYFEGFEQSGPAGCPASRVAAQFKNENVNRLLKYPVNS
jgi:hypothetical protein